MTATATKPQERTRAAFVSLGGNYALSGIAIVKGIVLVPVYFRLLGADVYGVWLASGSIVGLLGMLDAGISSAVYQRLGELWGAGDRASFTRTVAAAGAVLLLLGSSLALAGLVLSPYVPRILGAPAGTGRAISAAFALAALGAAGSILLANLIAVSAAWQQSLPGVSARVAAQLVEVGTIIAGLWAGWGVVALGLADAAGAAAGVLVAGVWTGLGWQRFNLGRTTVSRADVQVLLRQTAPLMVSRIVLQIDSNLEVALVSIFINPASAAIYAVTDRILHMAMSFINPIAGSVLSGLSHLVGERGRAQALKPARELISVWSLVVTGTFPTLLILNRDFTSLWVGAGNYGGLPLNIALFVNELLAGREWLFGVVLLSSGAIAASAWTTTIESLLRIPLMFVALAAFGWIGLPSVQAVVSAAFLVVYAVLVGRQFTLGGRTRLLIFSQGFGPLAVAVALGLVEAFYLPQAHSWAVLVLKGFLVGGGHVLLAAALSPVARRTFVKRLASAFPALARAEH